MSSEYNAYFSLDDELQISSKQSTRFMGYFSYRVLDYRYQYINVRPVYTDAD